MIVEVLLVLFKVNQVLGGNLRCSVLLKFSMFLFFSASSLPQKVYGFIISVSRRRGGIEEERRTGRQSGSRNVTSGIHGQNT